MALLTRGTDGAVREVQICGLRISQRRFRIARSQRDQRPARILRGAGDRSGQIVCLLRAAGERRTRQDRVSEPHHHRGNRYVVCPRRHLRQNGVRAGADVGA